VRVRVHLKHTTQIIAEIEGRLKIK
jgi:hypothetical protein